MKNQNRIRYLVIVVFLGIFCYQIKVALVKLMSNGTVDSTEYISISELDSPPVITFCPTQGVDWNALYKWGYNQPSDLMNGNYSK